MEACQKLGAYGLCQGNKRVLRGGWTLTYGDLPLFVLKIKPGSWDLADVDRHSSAQGVVSYSGVALCLTSVVFPLRLSQTQQSWCQHLHNYKWPLCHSMNGWNSLKANLKSKIRRFGPSLFS